MRYTRLTRTSILKLDLTIVSPKALRRKKSVEDPKKYQELSYLRTEKFYKKHHLRLINQLFSMKYLKLFQHTL